MTFRNMIQRVTTDHMRFRSIRNICHCFEVIVTEERLEKSIVYFVKMDELCKDVFS